MDKKILDALDFVKGINKGVIMAIPFAVAYDDILVLRDHPLCKGMVLKRLPEEIVTSSTGEWFGCFEGHGWRLPAIDGPIVFLGPQLMLTRKMALQVVKSGRFSVFCKVKGQYQLLLMHRFLMWRAGEKVIRLMSQSYGHHLQKAVVVVATQCPWLRGLWRRLFRREDFSSGLPGTRQLNNHGLEDETLYQELLFRADRFKSLECRAVPRRVVLVNAGLAAGGAERQIVNTLVGLKNSGQCESVSLLAEYIDRAPNLDFFRHELDASGIEVSQVERTLSLSKDGLSALPAEVAELLADIAPSLIEEILNLIEEFRVRRPQVVHAWQDESSIKAGIAAVIAGVPRIVLASRNVTPMNFTYFQDYMYPAYRALASLDCVTFLNNSEAGALDYTQWLGLPRERFIVVRNGVDLGYLRQATADSVSEYRQSLGIPENALVVGSIFRFWAEKRPMLWLQTAALVAKRYPDVHFLILGEGPMRQEMELFISANGFKGRVHLPGTRPDVATPLSAMNVFVLTSEFEGTPNVLLEAQWLGLPIVATDAGGTTESFKAGETGLLAIQSSAESLASLVGIYLDNDRMRAHANEAGPRFVAQAFGIQRMVEETLLVYGIRSSQLVAGPSLRSLAC